jgi:hypothetical protein
MLGSTATKGIATPVISDGGVKRHNVYMTLTSKQNETTENSNAFSLLPSPPIALNHTTDFILGEISGFHGGEYEDYYLVAPCSLGEVYQRFRGACCLHH